MQKASQPSCILKNALVFVPVLNETAPPAKLPVPALIYPSVIFNIWFIISALEPLVIIISAPYSFKFIPSSSVKQPVTIIFKCGYDLRSFAI